MIINDLIKFHREKLNNWNLIFKHMKKETILRIIILIVTAILIPLSTIIKNPFIFFISLATYVFLLLSTDRKSKKILNTKHGLTIKKRTYWQQITYYKVEQLKIFLKDKNKDISKDNIQEYINYLKKEAENVKMTNYISLGVSGLFLGLFIPVWNHFNSWYMNNQVDDISHAVTYLLVCAITIFIISFTMKMFYNLFKEIFDTQYRKYKELLSLLELVSLCIDEPISDETIYKNL